MTADRVVLAQLRTPSGGKVRDVKLTVDRADGHPDRSVFKVRAKTLDADGQGGSGSFVKLTSLEALTLASAIFRELGIAQRESP
jgi:hypothetical protein